MEAANLVVQGKMCQWQTMGYLIILYGKELMLLLLLSIRSRLFCVSDNLSNLIFSVDPSVVGD